MEALRERLDAEHLCIPMVGMKSSDDVAKKAASLL